ncbi:MAG: PIN domain nuclease [Gaiellaceae bacterium]
MTPLHLADTSAWSRSGRNRATAARWDELLDDGNLAICSPVRLELLYSARSPADYVALADDLAGLRELALDDRALARAEEVQAVLAETSRHRAARAADLYIAAVAELNDATLLHYDRHFDAIAEVTGQAVEWIAPRGTLD